LSLSIAQTYSNVLHYYAVRASKADVAPAAAAISGASGGAAGSAPFKRLDVFLERSVVIEGSALCRDIVGDSRAVLLGMADGSLRTYSWHAQVCIRHPLGSDIFNHCSLRRQDRASRGHLLINFQVANKACPSCVASCSSKAAWLPSTLLKTRSDCGPFSTAALGSCAAAAVRFLSVIVLCWAVHTVL
jgi:hypothetical protein